MSKITIKDISKALNLSVSTVSKALSNSHEISDATKLKVQEYAKLQGFTINRVAQSLKLGRTNTIGVIACAVNNDFVSQILDGIQKASMETDYNIIIMQSLEDELIEKSCIEVLEARGIDGLLISPVSENSNISLLQKLQDQKIPVVLFDRIKSKLQTHKFGVKNFDGAFKATQHLLEQGRKNLLHITGTQLSVANDRLNGFKSALTERGLKFNPYNYIACNLKDISTIDQDIRKALEKAFASDNKPDGIFGATDVISIRTLGILAEMGIRVPEDVAVIGFSNMTSAFALNPSLSTITQPASDIGYLSMKELIKIIQLKYEVCNFETVELDTTLHIRKSSV